MAEVKEITPQKTLEIIVDDGARRVPIRNLDGEEVGVLYFRPTDLGILARYSEVSEQVGSVTEPLANISIAADGTVGDPEDDEMVRALGEAEERLYKLVDYLLGGEMSKAFFGKMKPFSPVNGEFYCNIALEAVGRLINDQFGEEAKKIDERISKYTKAYAPQDHKRSSKKK